MSVAGHRVQAEFFFFKYYIYKTSPHAEEIMKQGNLWFFPASVRQDTDKIKS